MYEIVLTTWYQETPNIEYEEPYNNLKFKTIEDACSYLGDNYEQMLNEFPVLSINIKQLKL